MVPRELLVRGGAGLLYRRVLKTCMRWDGSAYTDNSTSLTEVAAHRFRTQTPRVARLPLHEQEQERERTVDLLEIVEDLAGIQYESAPALHSCIQAYATGVGNAQFFRDVENALLDLAAFQQKFEERGQLEEMRGGETKNRALQVAVREYADMAVMLSTGGKERFDEEYVGVVHLVYELPELVLVQIDRERRRQTIVVQSPFDIRENGRDEHAKVQEWQSEPAGVEYHQGYHLAALRIFTELSNADALDPEYSTVLVGHSTGGAVAAILGAYLNSSHYPVHNIITFGQPMVSPTIGNQAMSNLPLLRIVTALDAYVTTPVATDDARPFLHFGEGLLVLPEALQEATEDYIRENAVYVTMEEYRDLVYDDSALLEYIPPPAQRPQTTGYDFAINKEPDDPRYTNQPPKGKGKKKRR